MIEFVVVDISSLYNAVVGRDWLHRMKRVASILHQVIKFTTPRGEKTLYGDQVEAKQCYLTTVSTKAAMKEMHMKEEREILKSISRTHKAKVVEDLMRFGLDGPSSDCFFLTGSNLK